MANLTVNVANPFSAAASTTAASIVPGLANAMAAASGGQPSWNPFQSQQDSQRRPPLDRWTLFRINLWELAAPAWERLSIKNDLVTPVADFFVDEIRLVRFSQDPRPGAAPAASAAASGGAAGGAALGVPGIGRQNGGAGAGSFGSSGAAAGAGAGGGLVTASQGAAQGGVILTPGGGTVTTGGGSAGSGVSVVSIPNVAGGAVRPEGLITGTQPNPATYSANYDPGVRLLDTKTTVRVYLNSLCLAPNVAAWFVGCWCALCFVDVDPARLGPLQNTILGRYVVMQDFVNNVFLVRLRGLHIIALRRRHNGPLT